MKVMKFGGTSVGTVASLRNVKAIVESEKDKVIVVVSALGGVTDMLIEAARLACDGDEGWNHILEKIRSRHIEIIDMLVAPKLRQKVQEKTEEMLADLRDIYKGVQLLRDLSQRTLSQNVSFGERMSSYIISNILPSARLFNSLNFIKTERWFGKNIADKKMIENLVKTMFGAEDWQVAVVPGFISTDKDSGDITNLGRGGSDYTASILAAALDAEVLEIWTDVDGFMTADPRHIKNASVIDELSFIESMDLCNFGAKVVYPPTIYPVFHKNIPIRIKNTFNPSAPGTLITEHCNGSMALKGVSSINDVTMFEVKLSVKTNTSAISNRILNVFSKKGVDVLLSVTDIKEGVVDASFVVKGTEAERAAAVIEDELEPERISGDLELKRVDSLSVITAVGEDMKHNGSISARIINTLQRHSIDPILYAVGASEISFSILVTSNATLDGLRIIHENFLEQ